MKILIRNKDNILDFILDEDIVNSSSLMSVYRELGNLLVDTIDLTFLNVSDQQIGIALKMIDKSYRYHTKEVDNNNIYDLSLYDYIKIIEIADYIDIGKILTNISDVMTNKLFQIYKGTTTDIILYFFRNLDQLVLIYKKLYLDVNNIFKQILFYEKKNNIFGSLNTNNIDIPKLNIMKQNILEISDLINLRSIENCTYKKIILDDDIHSENMACVHNYSEIINRLSQETNNYFDKLNYENCIISGGFLYGLVDNLEDSLHLTDDIDIFLYGTATQKRDKLLYLLKFFEVYEPIYYKSECAYNIIIKELKYNIQIINTNHLEPSDIISEFDCDYVKMFYDGDKILCSPKCLFSLLTKITFYDETDMKILRLDKAFHKGLYVYLLKKKDFVRYIPENTEKKISTKSKIMRNLLEENNNIATLEFENYAFTHNYTELLTYIDLLEDPCNNNDNINERLVINSNYQSIDYIKVDNYFILSTLLDGPPCLRKYNGENRKYCEIISLNPKHIIRHCPNKIVLNENLCNKYDDFLLSCAENSRINIYVKYRTSLFLKNTKLDQVHIIIKFGVIFNNSGRLACNFLYGELY